MALSSSVLHLRDAAVAHLSVAAALDGVLDAVGFSPARPQRISVLGPQALPDYETLALTGPVYLVGATARPWTPIIQAGFGLPGAPDLVHVSAALSARLACPALCLQLCDEEVLAYTLHRFGKVADRYDSFPQASRSDRLSANEIEALRHHPEALRDLLPHGTRLEDLAAVLDRGWWSALAHGRLDAGGRPKDGYPDEAARLIELGDLLQLSPKRPYPYADWAENAGVDWSRFVAHAYSRR